MLFRNNQSTERSTPHGIKTNMTKARDILIRRAFSHEAGVLSDIAFSAKQSNGYSDAFMEACREELTITPVDIESGEYWLAEDDVIQGFVALTAGSDSYIGEIHSFFIAPAWQRMGTGKLLWDKILRRAEASSIHTFFLDADPAAVPFYRSLGFVVIGEVPSGSIAGRKIPRMKLTGCSSKPDHTGNRYE